MNTLFNDLLTVFFPPTCNGCGGLLNENEGLLCLDCVYHLPRTGFHTDPDNIVAQVFWGRVPLQAAASFLYFNKGNTVQRLLHQLKYQGNQEIGLWLGERYGRELLKSPLFSGIDEIIPVPLHSSKFRKRGYNQSELFAKGLAKTMGKPLDHSTLLRQSATETQTKKSRYQRWENVSEVFTTDHPERVEGKHILLVDDVLTTGATLEASARVLLGIKNLKVSVVTIAFSNH